MLIFPTVHPKLPNELTDIVIDHLHSDRKELAQCSLVCKAWIPASRLYLFERIEIVPHKLATFIELLKSTLATLAPYVRHLRVTEFRAWSPITSRILAMALTELQSLCLDTVSFMPNSSSFPFRSTTILTLRRLQFPNQSEIMRFVSSFPLLEELNIDDVHFCYSTTPQLEACPSSLGLRHLSMKEDRGQLLKWLCEQKHVPSVESVKVSVVDAIKSPDVAQSLKILGPSLHALDISCSQPFNVIPQAAVYQFDLSYNTRLTTLRFSDMNFSRMPSYLLYPRLISHLISPRVEHVEFTFGACDAAALNNPLFDWARLGLALNGPQSVGLKSVRFLCSQDDQHSLREIISNLVREKLLGCEARGILSIDWR